MLVYFATQRINNLTKKREAPASLFLFEHRFDSQFLKKLNPNYQIFKIFQFY